MLTVHKNTKERRDSKILRKELMQDAKALSQYRGISGYSIVVWDKKCSADCAWWSTPPVMPGIVVPEFSKQILTRKISHNDVNSIIDIRFE